MRRLTIASLVLAALAVPVSAQAASSVVVRGAGFGHGIGLSQYGAYGYAQKGFDYKSILSKYYTGTTLTTAPSRPIRVLLQASDPFVRVKGASLAGATRLNPTVTYKATPVSGGRVKLVGGGKTVGTFTSPLRLARGGTEPVRLMGRAINGVSSGLYRGAIEVRPSSTGGLSAVNSLDLDSYVAGVIAGEMPSAWSIDALRAQSVAARTYALAVRKPQGGFDVYPDTRSQVYRGVSSETTRSNGAVRDTAHQILEYGGAPAVTYFFSTSGGQTENVENSFVGSEPKPWLKSQKDPYDTISPKHRWTSRFSPASIGARLGAPGRFKKVSIIQRGISPRIVRARVYGTGGSRVLTGPQIRARLNLYDTWASFYGISSSQAAAKKGARAASVFPELVGRFDPAPRSRTLVVERRASGGKWKRVGTVQTTRGGRYRTTVSVSGAYRVRWGAVAGPAARIKG